MTIHDPIKAALMLVVLAGGFVMWALGDGDGKILVFGVFAYLTGNGVLALTRKAPSPVLVPSQRRLERGEDQDHNGTADVAGEPYHYPREPSP